MLLSVFPDEMTLQHPKDLKIQFEGEIGSCNMNSNNDDRY